MRKYRIGMIYDKYNTGGVELTHFNIANALKDEFDFKFFSLREDILPLGCISKIGHEYLGKDQKAIKNILIKNKIDIIFITICNNDMIKILDIIKQNWYIQSLRSQRNKLF